MRRRTRTIQQTIEIRAPPRKVYDALTNPDVLVRWFPDSARIEPKPGGSYRFAWRGGYLHEGSVLAAVAPRSLSLVWPLDGFNTRVHFRLTRVRGGTVLKFRQTGIGFDPRRVRIFVGVTAGWLYYFANLRALLETGRDLRRDRDQYW